MVKVSVNVLIADDSAFVRKVISDIISKDKRINIVDHAANGKEAIELVKKHEPDVLLLDLLMPKMNGLEAFEQIMNNTPTTTIILSAISPQNMDASIQALLMGAFDYIIKPGGLGAKDLPKFRKELLKKVLLASKSQIRRILKESNLLNRKTYMRQEIVSNVFEFGKYLKNIKPIQEDKKEVIHEIEPSLKSKKKINNNQNVVEHVNIKTKKEKKNKACKKSVNDGTKNEIKKTKSFVIKKSGEKKARYLTEIEPLKKVALPSKVVVIGASVGGPRTIRNILKMIPKNLNCPLLVVQHLNANFIETFVDTLNNYCEIKIKIAENNEPILPGHVYVAPGDRHMEISLKGNKPCINTYEGPPVHHCIPSIDILFNSAAKVYNKSTMGILLTGMGEDGVLGLGNIKKSGGITIAESQQTSVVYGMPKLAAERGYAGIILPNYNISDYIIKFTKKTKAKEKS